MGIRNRLLIHVVSINVCKSQSRKRKQSHPPTQSSHSRICSSPYNHKMLFSRHYYYYYVLLRHNDSKTYSSIHTHIQSYTQMHPLKRHKMIKTVKLYKGTEVVKHVRHRPTLLCWSGSVYSRVVSVLDSGARAWVQISVATLSG